jgi:hypothetical protein
LVWAFPAQTQTVLGDWDCTEVLGDKSQSFIETIGRFSYLPDGTSQGTMSVEKRLSGTHSPVNFSFSGTWVHEDDTLTEAMTALEIIRFEIDGTDLPGGWEAFRFKRDTMRSGAISAPIVFSGSDSFKLLPDQRQIACVRSEPSS